MRAASLGPSRRNATSSLTGSTWPGPARGSGTSQAPASGSVVASATASAAPLDRLALAGQRLTSGGPPRARTLIRRHLFGEERRTDLEGSDDQVRCPDQPVETEEPG